MELAKNVKNGHNNYTGRMQQNDNDAIDTDMHARAGVAELIPWLLVPDCAPQLAFCARHRGRVLPLYGLLAASQTDSWLVHLEQR